MSSLINTGELDFTQIKENLKTFLSNQTELADYDFDGSVISTLIDVLAYNTHYNALYTNLAVNEMFIDSASKRSSLASIAKLMGYTPRSITSARAVVNIDVSSYGVNENVLTLAAGAKFSTEIDNTSYVFNLIDDITVSKNPSSTTFSFTNVTLYEGEKSTIKYTQAPETRFVIPEPNVDMNTLRVSVYDPAKSETRIYVNSKSMVDTKSTDDVFFVKHIDGSTYEIFFGDGLIGTIVADGCIVTMSYLVSVGSAANGSAVFSYSGGLDSTKSYSIVTQFASAFGAEEEDKESIRFFAPLSYQAQNRAVTANDYAAIVAEMYPQIETLSVWGGQDHNPPQYGKVFICAKPYGRDAFSSLEKNEIKNGILGKRSVVTVVPEFTDPTYYDIEVAVNAYYNPAKTTSSVGQLSTAISEVVADYGSTLSKFDSAYRHSTLTSLVDSTDSSIISSINTVRIRYKITPNTNVDSNYSIDFKNPIATSNSSTFWSTRFYLYGYTDRGYLKNDGTTINFYTEDTAGVPYLQKQVGELDYNGNITLSNLNITALYDDKLEFVFYPSSYDVIPPNGVIVRIPSDKIVVNVLVDKLSQSRAAKTEHIFSPSR